MTSCIVPGNVQNVVTEMRYGSGGQLVELIAKNPVTGDQVTRYEYGVTLADSAVASNRLLRAEVYPDVADSSDRIKYSYNRQGQRTRMQDQNGSVHEYEHDLLGRQTADKVTTLGDGVDGAVRRIGTTYEVRGLVEKITSYSDAAGTTPVNEVQNVYNSFGQLKEQYQEHSGAANTGTTPKVQYAYADGSANTTRPTSMTYPNGRVLDYLYDDTHADKLSRIRTLRWDGTDVCRYAYLGLSTFVTTDYLQPQVKLDYALGSGANPYAGFDRFGRITDLLWAKYGASSSSSSSSSGGAGNDLVHLKYGYDRASNRTFREDLVAQAYGKDFDELYEYDGLHRLKKFHRGRLTDDNRTITSPTLQQGWQLDATGNWRNFTQNDQANASQTLDQQRLANRVNEITQIARTVGLQWATPEYDRNGNMTVIPQPKDMESTFQGAWDAWNRLVKLKEPNGSGGWQTLAEYRYDGQTWRTVDKSYASGVLDETRHFYFTSRWQDIEERLGSTPSSATVNRQFVWGQRYIDDLVLRDRDTGGGTLDERLYAMQDANWNVMAIADATLISHRFAYTPFGELISLTSAFGVTTRPDWKVLFRGRTLDCISHLFYFRSRYYAAHLGIFVSRDPAFYADGANLLRAYFVPHSLDPSGRNCDCCCCPGELSLSKIKVGQLIEEMAPARFEFRFRLNASLEMTEERAGGMCKIEWYECSSSGGSLGQKPGEWFRAPSPTDYPPAPAYSDFMEPPPENCAGKFSRYWEDRPTMLQAKGAEISIKFAVRVTAGTGCLCGGKTSSEILFSLHVTLIRFDLLFPEKSGFDPDPPVLTPGIDKGEPEKCTSKNIPWKTKPAVTK